MELLSTVRFYRVAGTDSCNQLVFPVCLHSVIQCELDQPFHVKIHRKHSRNETASVGMDILTNSNLGGDKL